MAYFGTLGLTGNNLLDPMITRSGYGGPLVETPGTARTIYYTFDPASSGYQAARGTAATAMTTAQQNAVKQVLAKLAAAADVKFVEGARYVSPLHNVTDQWGYIPQNKILPEYDLSFHTYATGYGTGEAMPDLNSRAADGGWIGGRVAIQQAAANSSQFTFLLLHETGHALGLKHPGNYQGGFGSGPYLPAQYDNTNYTVMSYNGSINGVTDYKSLDKAALSYIYGAAGADRTLVIDSKYFYGTDFDDTYNNQAFGGDLFYYGIGGNDLAYGGAFNDTMRGGEGDDRVFGMAGNDSLYGDGGYDMLDGGDGNDVMYGDTTDSSDILRGGNGNDSLCGSIASDSIDGGADNDFIVAGAGGDTIWGGSGVDMIHADTDFQGFNDTVYAGRGADVVYGYDGNDVLYGSDLTDPTDDGNDVLAGMGGSDRLYGGYGDDYLVGGDGADTIEGGEGHDRLLGGNGYDTLIGGNGNDILQGEAGYDSLSGGAGNDILYAGTGNDTLSGGTGNDIFLFNVAGTAGDYNYHIIADFDGAGAAGGDTVRLYNFGTHTVTDTGYAPITSASAFNATGIVSGADKIFSILVDGQSYTITVVGGAGMNAGDITWG